MDITPRSVNGVTILDLTGRCVTGSIETASRSLRALIGELVAEGRLNVLVHLGRLTDMDAHGLGELTWSFATLRRYGGQMALIAPSYFVRRMLAVTRLDTLFAVHDSEREAIASTRRKEVPEAAGLRSVCMATGA